MLDNKERFHKVIQWLLENPKEQMSIAAVGGGGSGGGRGSDRDSGK
jgi:hypothetical protein